MTPGWAPLAYAVGLCAAVAVLEGFLTGGGLKDWYPRLRKPRWHIPLWASVAVGLIVYAIDGFVAYRLLTAVPSAGDRAVALAALVVVMVLNALWNYAFFEYRSTLVGFLGITGFVGPLLVLQTALFVYEPVAAWAHMVYTLYVLAYDVPLFYAIWRLNPGR
ncbi:MAG TPA: tryptophan-rich sensory protein [Rubrobacter sp.]|nr:tryptophan-rich sensory protein [Rubrobacter sp.]